MKRSTQLLHILKIKEQAVHEAARAWHLAKEQYRQNEEKKGQLSAYRQDYIYQLHQAGQGGCQVGNMRNRINFITQLDTVLLQIEQQLISMANKKSVCERQFLQAKSEQDVIIKLLHQRDAQEKKILERLEQKEVDEYALKQWYTKKVTTKVNNSD